MNVRGTVAVSGASGFIGRAVMRELARRSLGSVRLSRTSTPPEVASATCLIHLGENADLAAAEARGEADILAREKSFEAARALAGFERVVYVSSGSLYGDKVSTSRHPHEQVQARGIYGRGKLLCEERTHAVSGGVVARLGNVFGPGMSATNVLSDIIRGFRSDERPVRVRALTPVRDFVWVEDVARALVDLALVDAAKLRPIPTFNVATGRGSSVRALCEAVANILGARCDVVETQPALEPSTLVLDITRTTDCLGWRPLVSLDEGLKRLLSPSQVNS